MHDLFCQVLAKRDLSKAGDLFSIDDRSIVSDLSEVLGKIQEIAAGSNYLVNDNEQSLVEICITRVTSAIRETGSIEQHANSLVALLESCLSQNLKPLNKDEDPPHAKIAADIISCIFLNYTKKEVMKLAVPVAVKFLHKGNKELSRNLSSYLSLAAIDNADLLAPHIQPIIDSIISGNYSLSRVLPQIYAVKREPIHDHVMALVSLLPFCDNPEKLSLLNLFCLIARNVPSLLEPSLPQLCECLSSPVTAVATLQIFIDMSSVKAQPFAEYVQKMKTVVEQQPPTLGLVVKVIGNVSRLSQEKAKDGLAYLVSQLGLAEHATQTILLKEIKLICDIFPPLLADHINEISSHSETSSSSAKMYIQQLKHEYNVRKNHSPNGITIVKVGGGSRHDLTSSGIIASTNSISIASSSHAAAMPPVLRQVSSRSSNLGSRSSNVMGSRPNLVGSRPSLMGSTHVGGGSVHNMHHSMARINSMSTVNQSLTRLAGSVSMNMSSSRIGSSTGIHKSMSRLGSSQGINRSVTVIGSRYNLHHQATRITSGGVTVTSMGSPTKSISSSLSVFQEEHHQVMTVSISGHHNQPGDSLNSSSIVHHPSHHLHHHHHNLLSGSTSMNQSTMTNTSSTMSSSQHGLVSSPLIVSSPSPPPACLQGHLAYSSTPATSPHARSSPHHQLMMAAPGMGLSLPPTPSSPTMSSPGTASASISAGSPVTVTASSAAGSAGAGAGSVSGSASSSPPSSHTLSQNRMSVFEPYPMRDAVQHFCEKHLDKIKKYMQNIFVKIPLPVKCTIEERKSKKCAKLHFACQGRGQHCLYNRTFFAMKTRNPRIWIHLMFLALQARASNALSTREQSVSSLKNCWDTLKADVRSFLTLVTSAFPSTKDQDALINELRNARFFDVFEYNGPLNQWGCFLCNHPDRASGFLQENEPVIEGQLKEKKGKWKIFKRWRTRYFTLSGAHLSCRSPRNDKEACPIEVSQIRSVKAIGSRGPRSIPKAFEIFTNEKTYVLKAKDGKNAEQWVQCLSIAVAHSHAKDSCR